MSFLNSLFGDLNEKELKRIWPMVKQIRAKEASSNFQELTLATLPLQTESLKKRLQKGETVNDILVDGFATVVRACQLLYGTKHTVNEAEQVWDMIPYDVQLVGGIVLHNGSIAEMKTGEGKTLVSTLPVYINALAGNGVHVVTVNDYLAKRDSAWMGVLFKVLGLTVGTIVHDLPPAERRAAYACDITYGTNNEYGFDYLRDNMTSSVKRQVQRGLHFAIVDEVDSILIDEARTPLIISQPAGESTSKYREYATLVRTLEEDTHFTRDEKQKVAVLTEEGIKKMEELLGIQNIYTDKGFEEVHHIEQALRAYAMYQLDTDYVVREGQVVIVDEFTGRLMPGRRYGHGLHQAIEAKEGVEVQRESKTLATITFQNYFRLYNKLSGMTGTAKTEEEEFESIYGLRTIVIPTNKPTVRKDMTDVIYRTTKGKFMAVAALAKEKHSTGQPILIGTTSIEKSEVLSKLLLKEGIPHNVLNAKNHEREAQIVASAGQKFAVTIATNMAGRGTDIKLGEGVAALGGLCIAGTERHESRRIDNQLRGRAGRQGDPGETRFFVSMEDELMRLFGGDRLKALMERMRVPEDQPLENMLIARSIESAQKRVEGRNFDIRRHVVQYDDVMNKHRDIIYKRRQAILAKLEENTEHALQEHSLHTDIITSLSKEGATLASIYASGNDSSEWNTMELLNSMHALHPALVQGIDEQTVQALETAEAATMFISEHFVAWYEKKCATYTPEMVLQAERIITLRAIDTHWMDHIDDMAHLREQVAFAGYAQRDPLIEYKDLGFQRFRQLLATIEATIVRTLLQVDLRQFSPTQFLAQTEEFDDTITNEAAIAKELETTGVTQAAMQAPGIAKPVHEPVENVPLRRPMPDSIAKFLPKKKK